MAAQTDAPTEAETEYEIYRTRAAAMDERIEPLATTADVDVANCMTDRYAVLATASPGDQQ